MKHEPRNVTCLAAELAAAAIPKHKPTPYRAAALASQLCYLGRSYRRLSERLCGGEEEWGRYPEAEARIDRADKRRKRLIEQAEKLCGESPFRVTIETCDLAFKAVTVRGPRLREETVCL